MTEAYYNEIDPFAGQWLRNLMAKGLISNGTVDDTDIRYLLKEIPGDERAHFFAGIGGWDLALQLAGWPDNRPVWTGSCPCQPYSSAGRRKGDADERNLWPFFREHIRRSRPPAIFGEQVAGSDGVAWLIGVSADLAAMGYEVAAADLCSAGVNSPNIRQRLYWVALAHEAGQSPGPGESRSAEAGNDLGRGGQAGGMAHAGRGEHERRGGSGILPGPAGSPEGERQERERGGNPFGYERETGGLEYPDGLQLPGVGRIEAGEREAENGTHESSPWDDFDIIPRSDPRHGIVLCRVEPGSFPLAHGIPRRLGPRKSELRRMAKRAKGNRVGRIRGYGNAINPHVAAQFISAVLEAQTARSAPPASSTEGSNS